MRFNIKPDSTAMVAKANNLNEWKELVATIAKFQNIFKDDPRLTVEWPRIMEVGETLTNIPGVSEFVTVSDGPSPEVLQLQEQAQQQMQEAQQAIQQMQQENQQLQQQVQQAAVVIQQLQAPPQQPMY